MKKAKLKATKEEIAAMRAEALDLGQKNAAGKLLSSSPPSSTLTTEHTKLALETSEVAAIHKHITDMELELARLKSTYPPENVRLTLFSTANASA